MGVLSQVGGTIDSTDIPAIGSSVQASSGNVANAAAVAAIAAKVGQVAYVTGFQVTSGGATAASIVTATIAGAGGGTMSYTYAFPSGASAAGLNLIVSFYPAIAASAANQAITLTLPAGGPGNLNAAVNIQGFYLPAGATFA